MEVAAESLFLIALVSAFLAAIAALVLLRPKTEQGAQFQPLRSFVFLGSILSLVCMVLYLAAQHEVGEKSPSNAAANRSSIFVEAK